VGAEAASFVGRPWWRERKVGSNVCGGFFLSRPAVATSGEGWKRCVVPLPPLESDVVSGRSGTWPMLELAVMEVAGKAGSVVPAVSGHL
jgi:hypothetical protein